MKFTVKQDKEKFSHLETAASKRLELFSKQRFKDFINYHNSCQVILVNKLNNGHVSIAQGGNFSWPHEICLIMNAVQVLVKRAELISVLSFLI